MEHLGDITKIHNPEPVWIVCGGSPCQDLSVAGLRKGLAGERSGLFMEQIRIVKEMRENDRRNGRTNEFCRPRFMVWENVPGAFSSNNGEDFRVVLEEIVRVIEPNADVPRPSEWRNAGCIMGHGWSVAWRVHDAQFWGVPQRRRRIALVADFGGECATEILFERTVMQGNTSESKGEGEGASGVFAEGFRETISFQDRCGKDGGAKESLSNETEQEHCQHLTIKPSLPKDNLSGIGFDAYNQSVTGEKTKSLTNKATDSDHIPIAICFGNGQVNDAMQPETVSKTLNCLADPMKVIVGFSENQFGGFKEVDCDSSSLKASGGSIGGQRDFNCDKIGALQASDKKGIGNQYVADGKVIIDRKYFQ